MPSHAEINFAFETARSRGDLVELKAEHTGVYSSVLTERWKAHWQIVNRVNRARKKELDELLIPRAKAAVKDLEAEHKRLSQLCDATSEALECVPPQGAFEYTGRQMVMRSNGATILVDDSSDEAIIETYRPLQNDERIALSKIDEESRQLTMGFDDEPPRSIEEPPAEDSTDPGPGEETNGDDTDDDIPATDDLGVPFPDRRGKMAN